MHERYIGFEPNPPTWEELLVGVITRKVLPEDDLNRPADMGTVQACRRFFRTTAGDGLTVLGDIDTSDGKWKWSTAVSSPGGGQYFFDFHVHEGELRLFPGDSELPLPSSAAEHLLGQIATSAPLEGTDYIVTE